MAAGGVILLAVLAILVLVIVTSGGAEPEATPTPSPTATPSPTPTPEDETPSPTPAPPETAYQIVYREFGQTEDVIWRAAPADPAQRAEIARIPHREGFGIKPSLSPDGKMLAYLSLPEYALSAQSSQAEAFILDLKTQDTVKVAEGIDLTFAPLWSPDGKQLYLRRLAGPEFLAANVIIVRVTVPPLGENTPHQRHRPPSHPCRPAPGSKTPSATASRMCSTSYRSGSRRTVSRCSSCRSRAGRRRDRSSALSGRRPRNRWRKRGRST